MLVMGIDEKEYKWKYYNYQGQRENASKLHMRARTLLKEIFPLSMIFEEIPLVGTFKQVLYLDLYLHTQRLAVEVHGEQHYKFNSFFYENRQAFARAQSRDRTKIEWCKLNNIDLVELPYDESDREWEFRIRNRGLCE